MFLVQVPMYGESQLPIQNNFLNESGWRQDDISNLWVGFSLMNVFLVYTLNLLLATCERDLATKISVAP